MNKLPTTVDVTVVGGGSAGLAAALASARMGAQTLLIERHDRLGGMGAVANVHTFCGLFHPDVSRPPEWLNPGIPEEIGKLMMQRVGTKPEVMGSVYVLRQHPTTFSQIAAELCANEPLLTVATNAQFTANRFHSDHWTLEIKTAGSLSEVTSSAIVDTTGSATLAPAASIQSNANIRLHRPALIAEFHNVSGELTDSARLQIAGGIVRAIRSGQLPEMLLGVTFRASPAPREVFVTLDLEAGGMEWNPGAPTCVENAFSSAKEALLKLWQHLRATEPAFSSCPEPIWPSDLGIRESARWIGDYVLTANDLLQSRRFEDEVALAGWPLEMRETARGPKIRYFTRPEPAGIPARCLRASAVPRLWFAGRCISADHEALSSVRVMGTCLATGQAAGILAAQRR